MSYDMAKEVKLLYARSWPQPHQVWSCSHWTVVPECTILLSAFVTGSPRPAAQVAVLARSNTWRTGSKFSASRDVARLPGYGYILLLLVKRQSLLKPVGS